MLKLHSIANLGKVRMCVGGSLFSNVFSILVVRSSFLHNFLVLVHVTFISLTLLSALHGEVPFLIYSPQVFKKKYLELWFNCRAVCALSV